MASWATPVIHAVGDVFSVTDNNTLANNETFLYQAPYGLYFNSVATTIASGGTPTQITLGGITAANYGFSVTSGANVQLPLTGIYYTTGTFSIVVGSGRVETLIGYTNTTIFSVFNNGGAGVGALCGGCVAGTAGQVVQLFGFQESGSGVDNIPGADQTWLHTFFVGSQ